MDQKSVVKFCKDLGCCDACCLRYLGLKNPSSYEDVHQFILKYIDDNDVATKSILEKKCENNLLTISKDTGSIPVIAHSDPGDTESSSSNNHIVSVEASSEPALCTGDDAAEPPAKRTKLDNICVSCLGVLQEETWAEGFAMVQDVLNKKQYECDTIACALSSPIAAILRERAITLRLEDVFSEYDHKTLMPLKEAWKWLFGRRLAPLVGKRLDSGAVAPLLVTLNIEYPDELQELEMLRSLAPDAFTARGRQRRSYAAVEFTRRSVEQALGGVTLRALSAAPGWRAGPPAPALAARPVGAGAAHAPLYVGGRYVKLSRALPQTPWLVAGRRMLHSSVQEIIFAPVAAAYGVPPEEVEQRLKLMSAGREDVDVRCLGTGRPFALEVTDPRRRPDAAALARACEQISADGKVIVKALVPITRELLNMFLVHSSTTVADVVICLITNLELDCADSTEVLSTLFGVAFSTSTSASVTIDGLINMSLFDTKWLVVKCAHMNEKVYWRLFLRKLLTREDLAQLKKGEETKCKTYEALCIKLGHTDDEPTAAPRVTARDVAAINAYRNTAADDPARVRVLQRTPLRVLHRRPLLARARALLALSARAVPRQPALFVVRLRTEAGTYVKEWAHGELRRTRPALSDALGARADILALDVADVELPWPPAH